MGEVSLIPAEGTPVTPVSAADLAGGMQISADVPLQSQFSSPESSFEIAEMFQPKSVWQCSAEMTDDNGKVLSRLYEGVAPGGEAKPVNDGIKKLKYFSPNGQSAPKAAPPIEYSRWYSVFEPPPVESWIVPDQSPVPLEPYPAEPFICSAETVEGGTIFRVPTAADPMYVYSPPVEVYNGPIEVIEPCSKNIVTEKLISMWDSAQDISVYEVYDGPIDVIEPYETYDGTIEVVERTSAHQTWFGVSTETPAWLKGIGRGAMTFLNISPQTAQTAGKVASHGGAALGVVAAVAVVGLDIYTHGSDMLDGDIEAGATVGGDIAKLGAGCVSYPIDLPWTAAYYGTRLVADGFDFGQAWEETEDLAFPIASAAGWVVQEGSLLLIDPIPYESIEVDTSLMPQDG